MCWSLPLNAAIEKQKSNSCFLYLWKEDPKPLKEKPKKKKKIKFKASVENFFSKNSRRLCVLLPHSGFVANRCPCIPLFQSCEAPPQNVFLSLRAKKTVGAAPTGPAGSLASKPQREFIIKEAQSISFSLSTSLSLSRPLRGEAKQGPDSGELDA